MGMRSLMVGKYKNDRSAYPSIRALEAAVTKKCGCTEPDVHVPGAAMYAMYEVYLEAKLDDIGRSQDEIATVCLGMLERALGGQGGNTSTKALSGVCTKCNTTNNYIGPEHLDSDGKYTCYTCKQNPYR